MLRVSSASIRPSGTRRPVTRALKNSHIHQPTNSLKSSKAPVFNLLDTNFFKPCYILPTEALRAQVGHIPLYPITLTPVRTLRPLSCENKKTSCFESPPPRYALRALGVLSLINSTTQQLNNSRTNKLTTDPKSSNLTAIFGIISCTQGSP